MLTTIATLALAAAPFAPLQEADTGAVTIRRQTIDKSRVAARMESKLGFTIYDPKSTSAKTLLHYAEELTNTHVEYFYEDMTTGSIDVGRRKRFIIMSNVIGIQDFADGREAALQVLVDLDGRLGAVNDNDGRSGRPTAESVAQVFRVRTIDLQTAEMLVSNVSPSIRATLINETSTILLQGSADDVASAEALLFEIDQPLPQITLHCTLIEAVDEDDPDTTRLMTGDVADSLSRLVPGKRFRSAGALLVRGSAGGNARFEVSSSLAGLGGKGDATPARVIWSAVARGLDPKSKTLTLDGCSVLLEIPTFQTTTHGTATQSTFSGYRSEGMTADLALRADETTIVGTLGGSPIYLSMRFTVED